MSNIVMIEIGLVAKTRKNIVLPENIHPDIHDLQSMFGHSTNDVALHPGFKGIAFSDVPTVVAREPRSHEIDLLKTHGVELYFRNSKSSRTVGNVLSGAGYIRRGIYWSVGFDGSLPMGLRFEDSPDIVIKKIGSLPFAALANALTGYYVWNLPDYFLHVGFSVMEQRVNRIFVAAHPYYSESLLTSSLLAHPA